MEKDCGVDTICVFDFCGNGTIQGGFKHQINMWADCEVQYQKRLNEEV